MKEIVLTDEERFSLIEWCTLINGYHPSCYDKYSDKQLSDEYERMMNDKQ